MKHLVIIGARGWGREIFAASCNTLAFQNNEYDVKGFLDDKNDAFEGLKGYYPPILGPVETYMVQPDDVFFCAMGDPIWRKKYAELIEDKGGTFISIVHPTARINRNSIIGSGSYIGAYSIISDNVHIGKQSILQCFNDIGHDAYIGNYVSIESYVFMGGHSSVGNNSTLHTKSSILPHKTVGDYCSVGVNSVVMKNVKDGTHVFGSPAVKI